MRSAALDPWLLATSMSDGDAASVVGIYARRMQIEETFRDTKNHRFGWSLGDVRLSTPQRTAVLLTLAALARHRGMVLPRERLLDLARGDDVNVTDRTVDTFVKRLRKKLREVDATFDEIETVFGVGYRYKD